MDLEGVLLVDLIIIYLDVCSIEPTKRIKLGQRIEPTNWPADLSSWSR